MNIRFTITDSAGIGQYKSLALDCVREATISPAPRSNRSEGNAEGLGALEKTIYDRWRTLERVQEEAHRESPYFWANLMGYPVDPHGYDAQCLACNQ